METILKRAEEAEDFLDTLLKEVITHDEFGQIYISNIEDLETEVTNLLSNLRTNRESLVGAMRQLRMNRSNIYLQSEVNNYRQNLETTLIHADSLWHKVQLEMREGIDRLETKLQTGEVKPREKEDISKLDELLDGLKKLRDFLKTSVDIKKAATEYLPFIIAAKEALNWLKHIFG